MHVRDIVYQLHNRLKLSLFSAMVDSSWLAAYTVAYIVPIIQLRFKNAWKSHSINKWKIGPNSKANSHNVLAQVRTLAQVITSPYLGWPM